jgi:hypothetical protein
VVVMIGIKNQSFNFQENFKSFQFIRICFRHAEGDHFDIKLGCIVAQTYFVFFFKFLPVEITHLTYLEQ